MYLAGAALLLTVGVATAQTPATTDHAHGGNGSSGTASAARAEGQVHMSEGDIKTILKNEGYSGVSHIRKKNNDYIADAKRYGSQVKNLKISQTTGMIENQRKLSHSQVESLLKKNGYSDIRDITTNGNTITAKARWNHHQRTVHIQARTASIVADTGQ
ncbi:MAG: hypothetical protein HIU92_04405 [Proteobacteria bacterium]|nr:hypothetical protein [Pseudomonadota bacterium]